MRKRRLIVLLLLFIVISLTGCKKVKYFTISGVVTDWEGNGIEGVHINITLNKTSTVPNETILTTTTDTTGTWSAIVAEGGVLVEPAKSGWAFTKMSKRYVPRDIADLNFVGTLEGPIYFKDINLEDVVREKVNKSSGDILVSDVIGLHNFFAPNKNIVYLDGMEYFFGVTSIYISQNYIRDISPLLKLKINLSSLVIDDNSVENIHLLEDLSIRWLYFDNNQISDISFLEQFTLLRSVSFASNQVNDINVLSNLINLEALDISSNPINDIQMLSTLKKLSLFKLNRTEVTDISVLENFTELKYLYLESTLIDDISVLLALANLQEVVLKDTINLDISEGTDAWGVIMELEQCGVDVRY